MRKVARSFFGTGVSIKRLILPAKASGKTSRGKTKTGAFSSTGANPWNMK